MLTKEQILNADDLKREEMTIPEWPEKDGTPGKIIAREATSLEREEYTESLFRPQILGVGSKKTSELKPEFRNSKARLVVKCVENENHERIFTDNDAEALGKKSAVVVFRIFEVIERLSGMGLKAEEVAEKNSDSAPSGSSPSPSPGT